jgi:two-component system, OmpR family, sensor histidine kinase BaeS
MRLRLILSYALIVLIAILSLVIIVRLNTAKTVETFMYRGGLVGVENLVIELEESYQRDGSWSDSEKLIKDWQPPSSHKPSSGRGPGGMEPMGAGEMMAEMMGQRIRLLDLDGKVLADSHDDHPAEDIDIDDLGQAISLHTDDHIVGYLLPESGINFSPVQEQRLLSGLNNAALTAGLIAGAVALVLGFLLTYSLMRPVRELTRAAVHMADGDLGQRVSLKGGKDIATLGETFNHMASSLQDAEARRRALTADIAHELRTPLAVQRAHLEALQDGIYGLELEALVPIEEQNHALTRLVEDLRTLALADAGQLTLECMRINYSALIERACARFDVQAAAREIKIVLSPMDVPLNLTIDPQRIEQVINNIISNAIRYTPPGGTITVELQESPELVTLSVRDTGPGISEESLPHVFERFYKADTSRNRDDGGTGLGLSIARSIAISHGGDMSASNHPQGGAVFNLQLPRLLAEHC